MKGQKNNQEGFTLIETFVAITILVIIALGPLGLLSSAISDGLYAKNQIRAYYLAQEGLDLLVYKRNLNREQGSDNAFDQFPQTPSCTDYNNNCSVDLVNENVVIGVGVPENDPSRKKEIFDRRVKFVYLGNNRIEAVVQVEWLNKFPPKKNFVVSDILFDYDK